MQKTVVFRRLLIAAFLCSGAVPAWAQVEKTKVPVSGTSRAFECTEVRVDYANDPNLTREERIRLMDQALFDSLGKFDSCQAERAAAAAANANAGGGLSGAEAASGNVDDSVASSDMSGDEIANAEGEEEGKARPGQIGENEQPKWSNPDQGSQPLNPEFLDDSDAQKDKEQTGTETGDVRLKNGKVPGDIPPADNDSVLEAQIRRAAINEKDPETKAKLWNEYRKYKGLPVVGSTKAGEES